MLCKGIPEIRANGGKGSVWCLVLVNGGQEVVGSRSERACGEMERVSEIRGEGH